MPTIPETWLEGPVASLPDPVPANALLLISNEGLPVTLLRTYHQIPRDSLMWAQDPGARIEQGPKVSVLERATAYPSGWGTTHKPADVSVIIPTMGDPWRLEPLLSSLQPVIATLREVLVVVNGAPLEPVVKRVQRVTSDPRVRVLVSAPGLSVARNVGMTQARGEYCALLDDDVLVGPTWRSGIDRAVATHPTADVFTGSVIATPAQSPAQFWFEIVGGFRKGFDELVVDGRELSRGQALVNASRIGTGAVMVLRNDSGLAFSEQLGAGTAARGGEDLDVVVCALVRGRTVVFAPDMLVRHPAPVDWPALRRQSFEYGRGLTALAAHQIVTGGVPLSQLLTQAPSALRTVAGRSGYASDAKERFPASYRAREAAGLLVGGLDYARSRWRGRRS